MATGKRIGKITSIQRNLGTRKCRIDPVEQEMLTVLCEGHKVPNPHMLFFQGILPSLDGFTANQVLDFQSGVLKLITDIRRGRYETSPPSTFLNPNLRYMHQRGVLIRRVSSMDTFFP